MMNAANALISNGTCYYSAAAASPDNVIPCGNVAVGADFQCCQAGDYCLDDSFCWNKLCVFSTPPSNDSQLVASKVADSAAPLPPQTIQPT